MTAPTILYKAETDPSVIQNLIIISNRVNRTICRSQQFSESQLETVGGEGE